MKQRRTQVTHINSDNQGLIQHANCVLMQH